MDLAVDFCPLLAQIQGYLFQHLKEDKSEDDLAESAEQFAAHVSSCLSQEGGADTAAVQSAHDLLLAGAGLVPLDSDCPHAQSVLAQLAGTRVPPVLYLRVLPAGLQTALVRRLRDTPRPAELRAALLAAGPRQPVCWPALPPLLAAWLQTGAAAEAGGLVAPLKDAPVTADGRAALALTSCLLLLLEHMLDAPQDPPLDPAVSAAAGAAVSAADSLFRRVTLSDWLEWAERDAPSAGADVSIQSALSAALAEVSALAEDARREGRAALLPVGTDTLLEVARPYASQQTISRAERLRAVVVRGRRSRRHLRTLLEELDAPDDELVTCLEGAVDLLTDDDLWRLLEVLQRSVDKPSLLRDRLVKLLVGELLKNSASEQRRRLVEHVLTSATDLRTTTWEQELRTASAQLTGGEGGDVSEPSVDQFCGLLLQSPRCLLHALVMQAAETGGKAAIVSALLPALRRRLPLHLLRTESETSAATPGLVETLIVDQLSVTSEVKPFRQLTQLLVAAVGCQLVTVDEWLAARIIALPTPKRLTLHLVQELLNGTTPRSAAWCCPLAQFAAVALDETLDLDPEEGAAAAAESAVEQRQSALDCLRLMADVQKLDTDGRLSSLSSRCHPITQLYVSQLLGLPPPPEHDPLMLCLTEETAPPWHPDQHTLLKATLASYLPYLCQSEWRVVHSRLLEYGDCAVPLAAPAPAPAERRPLARAVWYYGDLVTLWTTNVEGLPPDESLLLPPGRLVVCLRAIAVQLKRSLEHLSASCPDQYGEELSAVFLPVTHLMTLVSDPAARDCLDVLALYVTAEFIKQLTASMEKKGTEKAAAEKKPVPATLPALAPAAASAPSPTPAPDAATPVSPCMDWELDQMDASASTLSQFVVGCFNIPNDSPVKKRVLQHISGSVLGSLTPQGVPG